MPTDRRRDAATALTGAALLGAGGSLRHAGVTGALRSKLGKEPGTRDYPRVHLSALRGAGRGPKGLYLAGTVVGTAGAAGLSSGVVNLARRRDVGKRDKTPLWREGLAGTGEALRGRADSVKTPTPPKIRASQWAVAGAAGAGGSALARMALRHSPGRTKALLGPVAGGLAATASIPVSNRVVRRQSKGEYVVTSTGVRRAKDVIKKPSTKAHLVSERHGSMRGQVVPSDERFGKALSREQYNARYASQHHPHFSHALTKAEAARRVRWQKLYAAGKLPEGQLYSEWRDEQMARRRKPVSKSQSYRQQRAAITAAGATPLIGPYAQAHLAGSYAPRGERTKNAARQFAMGPLAGNVAGVGGAYGAAHLAHRATGVGDRAEHAMAWRRKKADQLRGKVGLKPARAAEPGTMRHAARAMAEAHPMAKPLMHNRGTMAAAGLGFLATRALVGTAGAQTAISLNQRDQSRSRVRKFGTPPGQSKREKHQLARTKRANAALATVSGGSGLTALGLLATRHKAKAIPVSIFGSGVGGGNALLGAHVQRREAHAIDPVKKGYLPELPMENIPRFAIHSSHGKVRVHAYHGENRFTVVKGNDYILARRHQLTFLPERKPKGGSGVSKDIGADHRDLIRRYGDRGPLPKGLARDEKIRAYEARYAAHGGPKGEKWQRRANVAEGVRNVALGAGTAALAGLAHLKTKRGVKLAVKHPHLQNRLDHAALTAGAVGGGAELFGELARDRRASYSNSPGGVAASALTRLRANTPREQR